MLTGSVIYFHGPTHCAPHPSPSTRTGMAPKKRPDYASIVSIDRRAEFVVGRRLRGLFNRANQPLLVRPSKYVGPGDKNWYEEYSGILNGSTFSKITEGTIPKVRFKMKKDCEPTADMPAFITASMHTPHVMYMSLDQNKSKHSHLSAILPDHDMSTGNKKTRYEFRNVPDRGIGVFPKHNRPLEGASGDESVMVKITDKSAEDGLREEPIYTLFDYEGEYLTEDQTITRYGEHDAPYAVTVNHPGGFAAFTGEIIVVDALLVRGIASMVNHSETPNCHLMKVENDGVGGLEYLLCHKFWPIPNPDLDDPKFEALEKETMPRTVPDPRKGRFDLEEKAREYVGRITAFFDGVPLVQCVAIGKIPRHTELTVNYTGKVSDGSDSSDSSDSSERGTSGGSGDSGNSEEVYRYVNGIRSGECGWWDTEWGALHPVDKSSPPPTVPTTTNPSRSDTPVTGAALALSELDIEQMRLEQEHLRSAIVESSAFERQRRLRERQAHSGIAPGEPSGVSSDDRPDEGDSETRDSASLEPLHPAPDEGDSSGEAGSLTASQKRWFPDGLGGLEVDVGHILHTGLRGVGAPPPMETPPPRLSPNRPGAGAKSAVKERGKREKKKRDRDNIRQLKAIYAEEEVLHRQYYKLLNELAKKRKVILDESNISDASGSDGHASFGFEELSL